VRVDCLSVQQGTQKGQDWAGAADRHLARIWAPSNAALDDDPQRVVWMPAHCSKDAVGVRRLGNGELLTALDVTGNALVDQLAKEAARVDRLPRACREEVRKLGEVVTAVATWIGAVTQLAKHFPDPQWTGAGTLQHFRDSQGAPRKATASASRCLALAANEPAAERAGRWPGSSNTL
jgi:hypothetical protein